MPWPAAVAGAQGQGLGASSARSSKAQLEHGIKSGTTPPAQLSPSISPTRAALCLTKYINEHQSKKEHKHTSYTGMLAHERMHTQINTYACTRLCG